MSTSVLEQLPNLHISSPITDTSDDTTVVTNTNRQQTEIVESKPEEVRLVRQEPRSTDVILGGVQQSGDTTQ